MRSAISILVKPHPPNPGSNHKQANDQTVDMEEPPAAPTASVHSDSSIAVLRSRIESWAPDAISTTMELNQFSASDTIEVAQFWSKIWWGSRTSISGSWTSISGITKWILNLLMQPPESLWLRTWDLDLWLWDRNWVISLAYHCLCPDHMSTTGDRHHLGHHRDLPLPSGGLF